MINLLFINGIKPLFVCCNSQSRFFQNVNKDFIRQSWYFYFTLRYVIYLFVKRDPSGYLPEVVVRNSGEQNFNKAIHAVV